MRTNELTLESPFGQRLGAYLAERFPLPNHICMVVIYFLANQFLAQVLGNPGEPLRIGWFTLLGMVFLFCIFFHLRVFDEHKDYADDCLHYPDRILTRGLITLTHLKILGGIALVLELSCAAVSGWPAVVAVVVTIIFSWIMLHEFFVRNWLRAHFMIYAVSHMLIMPLMTATIFSFTMQRPFWEAPWLFWAYAAADFFAFANWEISRKIRLPEDEIDGVSSYSKEFGMFAACNVVLALRILNTGLAWIVGIYLHLGFFYYAGLIVLFLITLFGLLRFRLNPTRKTAKSLEAYGGSYIILFYFVLAAELFRTHGVTFGGSF
ncbi:UbiA family prenyltransferase [Pontiellaceae bacterium B1224]|nr:UbiA family prenyltransferase [Pontiellaceae bacterium B1224]